MALDTSPEPFNSRVMQLCCRKTIILARCGMFLSEYLAISAGGEW